jgi:hypothetical protein
MGRHDQEEGQRNVWEEQQPHLNQEVVREIHTISGGIAGGGSQARLEKLMLEACRARRCIPYLDPRKQQN